MNIRSHDGWLSAACSLAWLMMLSPGHLFVGDWGGPGSAYANESEPQQWLLITTPDLLPTAKPLIERRAEQGFQVRILERGDSELQGKWNSAVIVDWIRKQTQSTWNTQVLIVGNWDPNVEASFVPTGRGTHGRMLARRTDHVYGLPDDLEVARLAVGRLPCNSAEQVSEAIRKIERFEDQTPGVYSNLANLWVGHPGGNSPIERQLGEVVVRSAIEGSLAKIHPLWNTQVLVDFPNTPYSVSSEDFSQLAMESLAGGSCFTLYAGHSGPAGVWSKDHYAIGRDQFKTVMVQKSPGVFFTTGCYACQIEGSDGEGYMVAAIRNPNGPVASIGAIGESYAVHGQLAVNALVEHLAAENPPRLLGEYWLSIQTGLGAGKISPMKFWLYDQADGTRGKVPLNQQRLEHAQMWMLLGDPALRIPITSARLQPQLVDEDGQGKRFRLTASIAPAQSDSTFLISWKRVAASDHAPSSRSIQNALIHDPAGECSARVVLQAGQSVVELPIDLKTALDGEFLEARILSLDKRPAEMGVCRSASGQP